MKKYQILAISVEQTVECYPIIKKFAKEAHKKADILMNFRHQTGFFSYLGPLPGNSQPNFMTVPACTAC
ncbi:hypothetical protein A4H97_09590 [Niastella yeongjuensis]|uniref:Uncharacterized protein n=1 Tax=Niastella yeongjuensis TaxID=354355 RepID=A0A1V9EER0_9BACT|nr:hypothetical protein [Niastella yeongjuensis]OQP44610.1 hypothetical protein A4H97_09590 [Niastella yeongjuensis]SEO81456.1 hypothetical protein SAMN05660816_03626 [Niastella yeongjuensis]